MRLTNMFFKTFREDIEVDFEKLKKIPKKYFVWKQTESFTECDDKLHIGTSAQEIQKIYPNLAGSNEHGHMFVNYAGLNIVVLKAIDLLYEKQEKINERIDKLLSRIQK